MNNNIIYNESVPSQKKKIIVLGSGPNRIGQGIEFDYCCVHGLMAIKECGMEAIMINCNPETVSTDFDIADKLIFRARFLGTYLGNHRVGKTRWRNCSTWRTNGLETCKKIA